MIQSLIADALVKESGTNILGMTSYTLPEVVFKEEEITGLGTGNIKEVLKNNVEALTLPLKISGVDKKSLQLLQKNKVSLVLAAAVQKDEDELGWTPVIATVKGSVKSFKMGEVTKGGKFEPEIELNLTYYKLEVDEEVIYEIDQINNVMIIDGKDINDGIRAAIGG